jgi:site-specific DNA-cytosine methylase
MKCLDLCCGAGGLSLGLHEAGFDVLGVELVEDAVDTHRRNVGPCDQASLWDYSPREEYDLVAGGIPCFVAGTMILAIDGYKPIEDIVEGDLVLTHLGRWRRVTATMRRDGAPLRRVKAQGVPGVVTTDEHPFYARKRGRVWDNTRRMYVRTFSQPEWVDASNLERVHYAGQVLPAVESDPRSVAFWWLVGRYLADGWIVDSRRKSSIPRGKRGSRVNSVVHKIVICCAHHESKELSDRIAAAGFHATPVKERTVTKFHIASRSLVEALRPFGRYAHGKRVPGFALALPSEKANAMLDGYLTGDGCKLPCGGYSATTVSKALALGMALIAQRARGIVAGVQHFPMARTTIIEGRVCSQRDQYALRVPPRNRSAFIDDHGYGWKLVRSSEPCGIGTVYNISVEEDESYVADGAIVHNCQSFSIAGSRKSTCDPRGQLYVPFLRIAQEAGARAVLIENVRGMLSSQSDTHGLAVLEIEAAVIKAGFVHVTRTVLDAVDYGAPQRRQRLFIVGFRDEADRARFSWPHPTHSENGGGLFGLKRWVTVREALKLGDGQFASGRTEEAETKNWFAGGRYMDVDKPAYTVMAKNNPDLIKPVANVLDRPSATVSAGGTETGGAEPFANAKYRKKLRAAMLDRPAPTIKANSSHEGVSKTRPSKRKWGELAAALDGPAPTVTASTYEQVPDASRPSRRPWGKLRVEIGALDRPAPCVSATEQKSALQHRSKGGKANARRCGDVLNPVLNELQRAGLVDRPSTAVDGSGRLSAAGHHKSNKHGAARVTVDQLRALQAFPEGFTFTGNLTEQHRQVGNAVPPPLGKALGEAIIKALKR